MKKTLFILLLLTKIAYSQIEHPVYVDDFSNMRLSEFDYPDKTSGKFSVYNVPRILLDKTAVIGTGRKATEWTFASFTEFEEIRGGKVTIEKGRYNYPVKIIAHDYAKPDKKYMFDIVLTFIDGRNGLVYDMYSVNTAQKIN